ncbi:MAG: hypothetical protein Q8908_01570 [Bacteroidota bacterium]|nr:hypothetical protein [Bacteroidota bacterium]
MLITMFLFSTFFFQAVAQDLTDLQKKRIPDIAITDVQGNPYQTRNISNNVRPFVDGQGWEFEVLLDVNQDLKRSMNVYGVPHTFVLNSIGEIVGQKLLYNEGDENEIFKMIKQTLSNN